MQIILPKFLARLADSEISGKVRQSSGLKKGKSKDYLGRDDLYS